MLLCRVPTWAFLHVCWCVITKTQKWERGRRRLHVRPLNQLRQEEDKLERQCYQVGLNNLGGKSNCDYSARYCESNLICIIFYYWSFAKVHYSLSVYFWWKPPGSQTQNGIQNSIDVQNKAPFAEFRSYFNNKHG